MDMKMIKKKKKNNAVQNYNWCYTYTIIPLDTIDHRPPEIDMLLSRAYLPGLQNIVVCLSIALHGLSALYVMHDERRNDISPRMKNVKILEYSMRHYFSLEYSMRYYCRNFLSRMKNVKILTESHTKTEFIKIRFEPQNVNMYSSSGESRRLNRSDPR